MHEILVAGAGKIGPLIACLLANTEDYHVYLADVNIENLNSDALGNCDNKVEKVSLDVSNKTDFLQWVQDKKIQSVISCLPYYCNEDVAIVAREAGLNYFDLTEDTTMSEKVAELAQNSDNAFVPQSGLAPGFISIVANEYMRRFDKVDSVLMRVGALPVNPNNALKYSLTWSTEGLINEYGNPCFGIVNGHETVLQPLEGLETVKIDGIPYEAFNTSGGLGTLADTYDGQVANMNYKTLRYPGHCEQMRLLMNDLKLNQDRETLKRILENAIPKTTQDVVVVYVAVKGLQNGELMEETYVNKVYPKEIAGKTWAAIQVTTASGACAVIDMVNQNPGKYKGFVKQEQFTLTDFLENRFGRNYISEKS